MQCLRLFEPLVLCLTLSLCLTACSGRKVSKNMAQKLIVDLQGGMLSDQSVEVLTIDQITARKAVVKTRVETAFALENVGNRWVVRQVRIGDGPWENLEDLVRALQAVKIAATQKMMGALAAAIGKYQVQNQKLPEFRDYISLSDALNPTYLTPLIRLDAWERPFAAYPVYPSAVRLVSAGPDGHLGTGDDIEIIVPGPKP